MTPKMAIYLLALGVPSALSGVINLLIYFSKTAG